MTPNLPRIRLQSIRVQSVLVHLRFGIGLELPLLGIDFLI
jgi:hypothetical protein